MRCLLVLALLGLPAAAAPTQSNPAFLGIGLTQGGGIRGCIADSVMRGGAAAEAGIEAGDAILAIELIPIDAAQPCDQLMSIITAHQPGDHIRLDVMRGSQKLVLHATLTTRAEVLQRRVGERLDPIEVSDIDGEHKYEISEGKRRTTVLGWFNAERCVGCSAIFDRVNDGLAKRGVSPLLLAVTPHPLSDDVSGLRRLFSASVPLAIADNETYGAMAMLEDNKRVFFMVVDCRGIIRLVAPIAADSDDLDASLDEVLAAVEQAEHARARR